MHIAKIDHHLFAAAEVHEQAGIRALVAQVNLRDDGYVFVSNALPAYLLARGYRERLTACSDILLDRLPFEGNVQLRLTHGADVRESHSVG